MSEVISLNDKVKVIEWLHKEVQHPKSPYWNAQLSDLLPIAINATGIPMSEFEFFGIVIAAESLRREEKSNA